MDDGQIDWRVREAARGYNPPPDTPREEMWLAIRQARRAPQPSPRRWRTRWVPLSAAAAAVLAAGVGLGRLSMTAGGPVPAASGPAAEAVSPATAYGVATLEHLSQSEAFLTLFRASVEGGGEHRLASATARRLLATNRLLLDSPAAADRRVRLLLEDLELVLAGIAQLSPASPAQDLDLIRDGIDRGNVMPRLRTAVPAGAVPTQGAL